MVQEKIIIPVISGPTATGKTSMAIEFALKNKNVEIINADSLLVYRHMDIGTAKPTQDERCGIPHHLIDIRNPDEPFTAGDFLRESSVAIKTILAKNNIPLIVGGTGFYLKALLHGMWEGGPSNPQLRQELDNFTTDQLYTKLQNIDPNWANKIGTQDRYRLIRAIEIFTSTGKKLNELNTSNTPEYTFNVTIIDRPNQELEQRVQERTKKMLLDGFVDEVKKVRSMYPNARPLKSVGYKQVCDYLDGVLPSGRTVKEGLAGLHDEICLATRQLIKRQRTWFKAQKFIL